MKTADKNNSFDKITNKLFFNIFTFEPDSQVLGFVKKYIPIFAQRLEQGNWSIYPEDMIRPTEKVIYSYIFKTHPLIKQNFQEGRIDFLSWEWEGRKGNILGYELWLTFRFEHEAIKAFEDLMNFYNTICSTKNLRYLRNIQVACFEGESNGVSTPEIEFLLMRDELYEQKYKIRVRTERDQALS